MWTDDRGDKVFSELHGAGKVPGELIEGRFLGGTGRYATVSGEYTFRWKRLIDNENGGVLYPIILSLAQSSGSVPGDESNRRLGGYLMFCGMASLSVSSALWLTATSANPIGVSLAAIGLLPLMLFRAFPPEGTNTPDAPQAARDALREMGSLSRNEWITAGSLSSRSWRGFLPAPSS
ncbi:MAG: hypothetical protein GQ542_15685 [Desulforhopalus sp.]|nr:hypothetical protein [Desulforhopalus sp.]